jgi:RNA polymerase primary sigma factor
MSGKKKTLTTQMMPTDTENNDTADLSSEPTPEAEVELSFAQEHPDLIASLIAKGKKQGFLTASTVMGQVPAAQRDSSILDDILNDLFERGIEILYDVEAEDSSPTNGLTAALLREDAEMAGLSGEDTIGMYLREMGRVPLLSADEEVLLAQQMERGKLAEPRLTAQDNQPDSEERERLQTDIERGEAARNRLIQANTRLVISIAKRYMGQGTPFLDLIQEGNLGLMRAVEKFDYRRGFRFSTYATWWIRQAISRAVAEQGRVIRLPIHMGDKIRRVYRVARNLEQSSERTPTTEEIADEMGLDPRRVEWLMELARRPVSLEKPVGEEEDSELGDLLVDQEAEAPADAAYRSLLKEQLEQVLDTLSDREALVLRLRYGLVDGRAYTLEEVGQKMNVTRERIRQIEAKALRKLRHPSRRKFLSGYFK